MCSCVWRSIEAAFDLRKLLVLSYLTWCSVGCLPTKQNANILRLKLSKYLLTDYWLDVLRSAYLFSHVPNITPLMPLTHRDSKALTGKQKI